MAYTLGIITGSGPEAGLDLWAKVLGHVQALKGEGFRGDLDAPRLVALSEPQLGLSMELAANEPAVRATMRACVEQLAPQVDCFAIACNTLNWYAPMIREMGAPLLAFQDVLREEITARGLSQLGLLAAAPVMALGEWSAYAELQEVAALETAPLAPLQELIYDVKRLGARDASLKPRFAEIIGAMQSDVVALACTELPLIAPEGTGKVLLDVTDCVAKALASRAVEAQNSRLAVEAQNLGRAVEGQKA